MLRIEHLTKSYGDKKAVDDLSLHIKQGAVYEFMTGINYLNFIADIFGVDERVRQ